MDVAKVIYYVFLFLGIAVAASILYKVFFDYPDGTLWWASRSIQVPMSAYYYRYCYIPEAHQSDSVDEALGGTSLGYEATPYNLGVYDGTDDITTFTYEYTTGWY